MAGKNESRTPFGDRLYVVTLVTSAITMIRALHAPFSGEPPASALQRAWSSGARSSGATGGLSARGS